MRSSVFDELFGVSVLPIHCGIRVDSSAHLVEDQTDHKGCRVVDSGLCDIVSPRGTTENKRIITYRWWDIARACKENRPMDGIEEPVIGEFLPCKERDNR